MLLLVSLAGTESSAASGQWPDCGGYLKKPPPTFYAGGFFAFPAEEADGETPVLECRRFPPVVLVWDGDFYSMWPQVTADDGCSEYMP